MAERTCLVYHDDNPWSLSFFSLEKETESLTICVGPQASTVTVNKLNDFIRKMEPRVDRADQLLFCPFYITKFIYFHATPFAPESSHNKLQFPIDFVGKFASKILFIWKIKMHNRRERTVDFDYKRKKRLALLIRSLTTLFEMALTANHPEVRQISNVIYSGDFDRPNHALNAKMFIGWVGGGWLFGVIKVFFLLFRILWCADDILFWFVNRLDQISCDVSFFLWNLYVQFYIVELTTIN